MEKVIHLFNIPIYIQIPDSLKKGIKQFNSQFNSIPVTDSDPLIEIHVLKEDEKSGFVEILNNPSSHKLIKKGFIAKYRKYAVTYWHEKNKLKIEIQLFNQGNKPLQYLRKLYNIQYENIEERLPQIIWENCLYPSVYFFPQNTLVHCSGFSFNNKEAILLGGTGGVGKTSLELELSKDNRFGFLNDDIAVLNRKGEVYPNLSWPKIYAYNLVDNPKVHDLIFSERDLTDKLAWKIKKNIFGPSQVRRTVDPHKLFAAPSPVDPIPLKKYIFLSRGNYSQLTLKEFNSEKVAELNTSILKTEFADFEKHIHWHYFNSTIMNEKPIIDLHEVYRVWLKTHQELFNEVDCYIMEIPLNINHNDFRTLASSLIINLFE